MVENWLESLGNRCPDGYEVSEGPAFQLRAQGVIGSIENWDEIRRIHDWALSRDPHRGGIPIYTSNLWMRRIDYHYILVLFYTIDEENCRVVYQDVRRLD